MMHKVNIRHSQPQPDHAGNSGMSNVPQNLSQPRRGNCPFCAFIPCTVVHWPQKREQQVMFLFHILLTLYLQLKQIWELCAQSSRESCRCGLLEAKNTNSIGKQDPGGSGRAPALSTLIGHVGSIRKVLFVQKYVLSFVYSLKISLRCMYLEHYNTLLNFQKLFLKATYHAIQKVYK